MNEDLINILGDKIGNKIQKANEYFLTKIGEAVKRIRKLTPTQAHQLVQMLKYGGNYEEILMEISNLTGINPTDIDKIFAQYSKNDLNFAKNFYEYKNLPFIPFDQNEALKRQTQALANITKNAMNNFTRSRALGYTIKNLDGTTKFRGLRETYESVLDEAVLNVGQGKDTFDSSMSRILRELGESGIRTLDYASGRSIRLDSMVRMHLKSGLRELHNENQRLFGEEFGAGGVEISVHEYPAEDHQDVQGRQFSYDEFNNIQTNGIGEDYTGKIINIKTGKDMIFHRPISEYNCYHYTFSIILGVSKPRYTEEQLKQIIDRNNKGFEYEGKHYTMYEGTQLQRGIEREIRKQKDIQIVAKASDNTNLVYESQQKITQLTNKYRELSKVSGLKTKMERAKVSGYKRTKVEIPKVEKPTNRNIIDELKKNNIEIDKSLLGGNIDKSLKDRTLNQLDNLVNKYPVLKNYIGENGLVVKVEEDYGFAGGANFVGDRMELNKDFYEDKALFLSKIKEGQDDNWSSKIAEKDYDIYTVTHETGHILEDAIIQERMKKREGIDMYELSYNNQFYAVRYKRQEDVDIFNEVFMPISEETGINWKELEEKYISDYGKSQQWHEWFAELFTKMELGEKDIMTERLRKFLEDELWKK